MNSRTTSTALAAILISSGLLAITGVAHAASNYVFTDLGAPVGNVSFANAINNAGQVVGYAYDSSHGGYQPQAILWNGTTATQLSTLGGTSARAFDINNLGQIVGSSDTLASATHATLWEGGAVKDLSTLGGTFSIAQGINDQGQIVGYSHPTGSTTSHATLWDHGSVTDLSNGQGDVPSGASAINNLGQVVGSVGDGRPYEGGQPYRATVWTAGAALDLGALGEDADSSAQGINDAGQMVGSSKLPESGTAQHAMLWDGSVATDLATLSGSSYSMANSINNAGQIVGMSLAPRLGWNPRAVLWNGAEITDLNSLLDADTVEAGWVLEYANDINDNGWIVGSAHNVKLSLTHAFLLMPSAIPEPSSQALMLLGLGAVGLAANRRRQHHQA